MNRNTNNPVRQNTRSSALLNYLNNHEIYEVLNEYLNPTELDMGSPFGFPGSSGLNHLTNSMSENRQSPQGPELNARLSELSMFNSMLFEYNQNMRLYQQNIRDFIPIMQTIVSGDQPRNIPRRTPPPVYRSNTTNHASTSQTPRRSNFANPHFTYRTYSPIVGGPTTIPLRNFDSTNYFATNSEVRRATVRSRFLASTLPNEEPERCPISMEHFMEGDSILQIRSCGHRFKEAPLLIWFRRDSRCPICRYDIRNYTSSASVDISSASIPTTNTGVRGNGTEPGQDTSPDTEEDMGQNMGQETREDTENDEETSLPDLISLNESEEDLDTDQDNIELNADNGAAPGRDPGASPGRGGTHSEAVHSNTDEIVERLTELFSNYIQDFSQNQTFMDASAGTYIYSFEFPVNLER
jgi:hypothetical protein